MTTTLRCAAALVIAIAIAHSYLGERYILMRLFRRADLPKLFGGSEFTTRTLRFAWHLTSISWFGFAALLLLLSKSAVPNRLIGYVVGWTFMATAVAILVGSRGRHLAWPLFAAVALAVLYYAAF